MGKKDNPARNNMVAMDPETLRDLIALADEKGMEVETLINIQMRSYVRASRRQQVLRPDDAMPYGKYQGETVEDIIKVDPRYICYLVANSDTFKLDEKASELLEKFSGR